MTRTATDGTAGTSVAPADESSPVPLVIVGIGGIGQKVLEVGIEDDRFVVRACVDPRDDRETTAARAGFEGPVYADLQDVGETGGVAAFCMGSRMNTVVPLAVRAVDLGYEVVTTAEELIAPWLVERGLAADLDRAAREAQRTVIACGVNPGFAMDVLPAVLTSAVRDVEGITILRRTDVGNRRIELQRKLGVGAPLDELAQCQGSDSIGHVGLRASIAQLATVLGWHGECEETLELVPAPDGRTARGVRHRATARDTTGRIRVDACLEMYVGVDEIDRCEIRGIPDLTVEVVGGIPGDEATVSAVLNTSARAPGLPPGLLTPVDLLPLVWSSSVH